MPEEERSTQSSEQNYTYLLKNYTEREGLTKTAYTTPGKRSLCKSKVTESSRNSNYSKHTSNFSSSTRTPSL